MKHYPLSTISRTMALLCLCFFLALKTFAQTTIGRQKVDQYPVTSWGTLTYGLTWLPTDYATSTTTRYPLIIFLHGAGEVGDGVGGLYNLISTALPQKIAQGWNPEAVNPLDGQNYKFIVVSPQAPWESHWSYSYGSVRYILADVLDRYRVDPSRVYISGLSAGGAGTWSCVTNGPAFAQKIAAIVPVSAAGTNTPAEGAELPLVGGTYGVKTWNVCGAADAWMSFATTATATINTASPAPVVPASLTGLAGLGHETAAWNTAYSHAWRTNSQNLNIYEWMLKYKRTGIYVPPVNQLPTANAGTAQTITLPSSVQLNGSGTDPDGSISSYSWSKVSGPSGGSFSNSTIANPMVTNLSSGTYVFRLTVKDNLNATATSDVIITVHPPLPISYTTIPAKIEAEDYHTMSGVGVQYTWDIGGGQNVGWIDDNDWMNYSVNVPASASYLVKFRLATEKNNRQFQLRKADGTVLTTVNVPNTGSFQQWQTTQATVTLTQGQQVIRLYATNGEFNINWIEFITTTPNQLPTANAGQDQSVGLPLSSIQLNGSGTDTDGSIASYSWSKVSGPSGGSFNNNNSANAVFSDFTQGTYVLRLKVTDNREGIATDDVTITVNAASTLLPSSGTTRIEAEDYATMSGVVTEYVWDIGGGKYAGWIDNGDWMNYSINAATAGTYTVNFRLATFLIGAKLEMRKSDGTVLTTLNIPQTGGYQNWHTVSATVTLAAGQQTIRIISVNNVFWNINWMEFTRIASVNQAPSVNAGTDQTITLPANSVTLSGTATDVDGSIASYAWSKVSGPAGNSFSNASAATTTVSALVQGTYTFRLMVADNGGTTASDIVKVTVNAIPPAVGSSFKIEAEEYSSMSGVEKEPTTDVGGGQNVGWINNGDWMNYTINPAVAGSYIVNFRVASGIVGGTLQLKKADGSVLSTLSVPITGDFQNWITITTTITLAAGQQTIRLYSVNYAMWNINWMQFTQGQAYKNIPATVQSESYDNMKDIQTQLTQDAGGGLNVGWIDDNDWMDYKVNAEQAGVYAVKFRVATEKNGVEFQLRKSDGTVLLTVPVPNTGGYQNWQTVSMNVTLPQGQQTLRLFASRPREGFNINWMEFIKYNAIGAVGTTSATTGKEQAQENAIAENNAARNNLSIEVLPNPVTDQFVLRVDNEYTGQLNVQIVSLAGIIQKRVLLTKAGKGASNFYLSAGDLPQGEYIVIVQTNSSKISKKIIKL